MVPTAAIRTVTAGVLVKPGQHLSQLAAAAKFLRAARAVLQGSGYVVQTLRVTTQPCGQLFSRLPTAACANLLAEMKAALGDDIILSIGPGNVGDSIDRGVAHCQMAARLSVASSLSLGDRQAGINHGAIRAAAGVIHNLATADPMANFNFGAIANVGPGIPFFPAGYHGGPQRKFAIGTEGASLLRRVCADVADIQGAHGPLVAAYSAFLKPLEQVVRELARDNDWHFAGIDTTPAQWGDESMGAAIESLTGAPFGAPGTLAACQLLTGVVKSIPVRRTGYQGLFLPPLEDTTLAARAHDHYGLSALLSYSAVCGTGLDAVAIPGDTTVDELARILLDIASLAIRLDKPLTGRLFPVAGRSAGQDSGAIGDLFPMKVLAVR